MKLHPIVLVFCIFLKVGSLSAWAQTAPSPKASTIDLGTLERQGALALWVDGSDPKIQTIARRAFQAHGAFKLSPSTAAGWNLSLSPLAAASESSSASVTLRARLKSQQGTHLEATLTGPLEKTVLKLCDWAVEAMIPELKGFFSSELVFVRAVGAGPRTQRELCAGTLFFEKVEQLTHFGKTILAPRLSFDRKKILYTSDHRKGFDDLFEYDRATGKSRLISAFEGTNTGGTYAPRGAPCGVSIAMILSCEGAPMPYVADANGKNLRRLVPKTPLSTNASPSFSPDGKSLVFTSSGLGKKPQLYVQRLDLFKQAQRLNPQLANSYYEPAWNPVHAQLIAFTAPTAGSLRLGLYDTQKKTASWIPIALGPKEDAVEFQWCRDGRHGIYTRRTRSLQRIHLLDTLTGKDTPLTPGDFGGSTVQGHLQ